MVGGQEVPIDSDFRAGLRIILAFEDPDLTMQERYFVMLKNLFGLEPHELADLQEASLQAVWFMDAGRHSVEDLLAEEAVEEDRGIRLYSFTGDTSFIYAAFRQTYGIDLEQEKLHWWKFVAMFTDLGNETAFNQLCALRKRVKTGKASKEEKQHARELGSIFEVPEIDDRTLEEKLAEQRFLELVGAGKKS